MDMSERRSVDNGAAERPPQGRAAGGDSRLGGCNAGGNLAALQLALGHSSIVVTQRYARLTDEHVRAEAERIAGNSVADSVAETSHVLASGAVSRVSTPPERCESG